MHHRGRDSRRGRADQGARRNGRQRRGISPPVDRGAGRTRTPRADDSCRIRRSWPRHADHGGDHRRSGAALPIHRDGVSDAPVWCGVLRDRAGKDGEPAARRGRGAASVDARVQREGIAQPFLGAGQPRERRWGRRGPCECEQVVRDLRRPADGYVVSTLSTEATTPIESTIYYVLSGDPGVSVAGAWRGLGMRGNASAPMSLDDVVLRADRALTAPGNGLDMMLGVVLPAFQVGTAAVAVGIAEAAVQATVGHVTDTRLEHMNSSLSDLPTVRALIARMRIETDRACAHLAAVLDSI